MLESIRNVADEENGKSFDKFITNFENKLGRILTEQEKIELSALLKV